MRRWNGRVASSLACVSLLTSSARAAEPLELDPAVRVVDTCYLDAVAFRTERDGTAIDACGAIFRTADGGKGWVRDRATESRLYGPPSAEEPDRRVGDGVEYLHWWSEQNGVAGFVEGFAFLTSDGGATWRKVPVPFGGGLWAAASSGDWALFCNHEARVVRADARGQRWSIVKSPFGSEGCATLEALPDGRILGVGRRGSRWITADRGGSWARTKPPPGAKVPTEDGPGPEPAGCPGTRGDEVVHCEGHTLLYERPGSPPRRWPIVTPASGAREALVSAEKVDDAWYGHTLRHMAASWDGRAWYVLSDLPATPARVTYLPSELAILEAADGRVFRGYRGIEWIESTAPALDRADAEQQRTGKVADAAFACVASAPRATLEVLYTDRGCFHHMPDQKAFRLEIGETGARVTFSKPEQDREAELARPEAIAVVQRLARGVQPLERAGGCMSTSSREVTVRWTCDGGPAGEVSFSRDVCGEGAGTSTQSGTGRAGYSRALEIERVVHEARGTAGE